MIKTVHSYWAYLVLVVLLIAVIKAFSGVISKKESDRFLKCVQNLPKLKAKDLMGLNVEVKSSIKDKSKSSKGIF